MPKLEGASLPNKFILATDGDGLWSSVAKAVRCTGLEITYVAGHDDDGEDLAEGAMPTFGELQVQFDLASWNPDEDGLIYTDRLWESELRTYLKSIGFSQLAVDNVGYSEQGMQGDDYVSLDVGMVFLSEAAKIFELAE